jgi:hypothetical protein
VDDLPALVDKEDLDKFPGAPYDQDIVDAACASVRAEAGWHIAPSATRTVALDGPGAHVLMLPSLHVTKIDEVRDITDPDSPKVLDDWRVAASGILHRRKWWPDGFQCIEVDMQHGYERCPAELLPVIAARCEQEKASASVRQEASGTESVTYASAARRADTDRRVQRYRIPGLA